MSYVYCWYEPKHHAIKLGCGENPPARMRDYAKVYGLQCEEASLHTISVPHGVDVQTMERHCHIMLRTAGLQPLSILGAGGGATVELFALGAQDYDAMVVGMQTTVEEKWHELIKQTDALKINAHTERVPRPKVPSNSDGAILKVTGVGRARPGYCVDVALKMIGGGITAAEFRSGYERYVASLPDGLPGGGTPDGVLRELVRRGWVAIEAGATPSASYSVEPGGRPRSGAATSVVDTARRDRVVMFHDGGSVPTILRRLVHATVQCINTCFRPFRSGRK